MKILLSAFVCEPGLGSEEGVGWGTAWSLAQSHRVHVLTRPHHRAAIEHHLAANPCPTLSFSYHDFSPRVLRCVVSSGLWQIYYHAWQNRIASWARATATAFEPDIVHHITYGRYWTPCSLWQLGRPFVWGPLGGGDACPPAFLNCLSRRERIGAACRGFVQTLAGLDPKLRATAYHAAVAVASTPATGKCLERLGCRNVQPLLQMALPREAMAADGPLVQSDEGVLFCSVGRLLGWKGHALTLRAFARASIPGARLVIVGDGPSREHLTSLAHSLGISGQVTFSGPLAREEAQRWIQRSIALVHSSFHDQAPTVIFEAMALGRPVVALDLGGPSRQVTADTGFLIPAHGLEQAVADMALALQQLAQQPGLGHRLGAAGRQRVLDEFTWDKKAEQFTAFYRAVLAEEAATQVKPLPEATVREFAPPPLASR